MHKVLLEIGENTDDYHFWKHTQRNDCPLHYAYNEMMERTKPKHP